MCVCSWAHEDVCITEDCACGTVLELESLGKEVTSTIPAPVCGTEVFIMCLCKCFIQSSCTDKGPWKTRSQNLHVETITMMYWQMWKNGKTKLHKKNFTIYNMHYNIHFIIFMLNIYCNIILNMHLYICKRLPASKSVDFLWTVQQRVHFLFWPRPWSLLSLLTVISCNNEKCIY